MTLELPFASPFTNAMAAAAGIGRVDLVRLQGERRVVPLLRGVYVAAGVRIDLDLRIAAVSLVVPEGGIVVDRTAAWLHGLDLLRRSSFYEVPPVEVYVDGGTRMRRPGVDSGCRALLARDVMEVGGVRVTTPVRTCLDLARLMWRYDALGAVDQYLALGVTQDELLDEVPRFRGFRWVTQARRLIPLGDARAESMPESALRLHWYDALSAAPQPQVWVADSDGIDRFRIDVGCPRRRYGAEYDGEEHHTSTRDREHDRARRDWLRDDRGWEIDVLTARHLYGLDPHPVDVLQAGWERTRSRRRAR